LLSGTILQTGNAALGNLEANQKTSGIEGV
jgi:hypothetical protein